MFQLRAGNAVLMLICLLIGVAGCGQHDAERYDDADVIVVGSGLAGLSAAVEMGRAGVEVLVIDMNSVPGGTAVRAGGVALVGTPLQERAGFVDSADLAYRDWMAWTEEGDPEWTRFYAENSRRMIYDWVTEMGVEFVRVVPSHGNSVPRFHFTAGRAVHLVLPLYRTALGITNVSFRWNYRATELLVKDRRVTGVVVRDVRSGKTDTLRADHVILATGGFGSDLDRVLANWLPDLPPPDSLMVGSSVRATGSGHDMASGAGAALTRIDRHYIYVNGLPDPRDLEGKRTLTAGNEEAMWVNASGERFTNETGFDRDILADLVRQKPSTYWMVFDEAGRDGFGMRGAAWLKNPGRLHPVLDNPQATRRAESLEELAAKSGLPAVALARSVQRFNAMIDAGEDTDFGRFNSGDALPPRIEQAPFYAVQMFPVTRKNMGGVAIDAQTRVLDTEGRVIAGLYAVGELTGSVGINGKYGLDGMFLGPAILTGRLAGQSVASHYRDERRPVAIDLSESPGEAAKWMPGMSAEHLQGLLQLPRDGYWHFEESHRLVLERDYECEHCHSTQLPFTAPRDRQSMLAQTAVCTNCH